MTMKMMKFIPMNVATECFVVRDKAYVVSIAEKRKGYGGPAELNPSERL